MGEYPAAAIPDEVAAGNLRALFVLGGNVATALADTERVHAALRDLDLLVVLEVARTATTDLATHVLACHGQLERADITLLNDLFNPVVAMQYTPAVLQQHPGRRPSWWIITHIATSLGVDILPADFDPDGATDDDLLDLVAGKALLDELRESEHPWVVAPSPRYNWVHSRLPSGRWDLAPAALVEQMESLREPPSLVLTPRRQPRRINGTGVREGDRPEVLIHPVDAQAAGVTHGEMVEVMSATGSLRLAARITDATRPGAASIPHGWPDCNVNRLISGRDVDPLTGMPRQSGTPIEIRPDTRLPVEPAHPAEAQQPI
jgi:anaerobic selenocysteine-containing dehydrogenase